LLRWLVPTTAAAAAVAVLLVWRPAGLQPDPHGQPIFPLASPALKADDVEIGRQLVAAFDAVGHLPDGEPVRFRCREWADEVVLHDSARGIVVEQRTPRLEIVAVNYETY
jgi:hypothetical protein